MTFRVRRGLFAAALAWSCAATLISCTTRREGARREPSTVTILLDAGYDERILGPEWDENPQFLVFLPLVEMNERGEPQGRLAQRWSHSPDFREWTFHLRQDVRWHDGVPVTARDVQFTLDLSRHPAVTLHPPDAYRVHVLDDSTLTITYPKAPRDPFQQGQVFWPKHLLERLDPSQINSWDFWVHPVGDGPYRYVRHVPKTMIELEANPDFYAGRPRIERVILRFGGSTPVAELVSGSVDVVASFNPADLRRIAADPRFRTYYDVTPNGLIAIFWNHHSPLLSDATMRRALTLGIDRNELRAVLNLPPDLPVVDALFTPRQYRRHELPAPLPYDPDSAARLLDAAGWRDADGDGVRERDGREFRFAALARGGSTDEQAAVYVQAQLRRIGIHMDVQAVDASVVWRRVGAGEFEAAFLPLGNDTDHPLGWFGERSPIGFRNPRVVALLRAARATADPDETDRIYRELSPVLRTDLPVTFLYPVVETVVTHRRVHGLRSPFQADPFMRMEHLWLEGGR